MLYLISYSTHCRRTFFLKSRDRKQLSLRGGGGQNGGVHRVKRTPAVAGSKAENMFKTPCSRAAGGGAAV